MQETIAPAAFSSADPTRVFARAMGPFLLVLGGALLVHAHDLRPVIDGLIGSPALLFVTGLFTGAIGWALLATHWRWRSIAQAVLTLLSLSLALRGALMLFVPDFILNLAHQASETMMLVSGAVTLAIGLYLAVAGWLQPVSTPL